MKSDESQRSRLCQAGAVIALMAFGLGTMSAATVYSNDPNLSDFTATVSAYATFSNSYQPTTAILLGPNYPRVIGTSSTPINVTFATATANIVVFDNIDHLGYAWDVFQYKILGSNDGVNYTPLFDPQTVHEPNQPGVNAAFTLNAFTGTAPTLLNNTLTPGLGSNVGDIGYEEYFTFGSSYSRYRFLPSTLTLSGSPFPLGEDETELSAVGIGTPSATILATATPEPASFLFAGAGLAVLLFSARRLRRAVPTA